MSKIRFVIFITGLFFTSCREIWGDHPLGNNLSLLEGDKKEDRIIVYCPNRGGTCTGGIQIVPKYERQFDSEGRYAEYVELAVSNKKWVAVRTLQVKDKKKNYWLISKNFDLGDADCSNENCDSILQSLVIGPLNLAEFKEKRKALNVDLNIE
jgi:hypothetical protein